MNNKWTANEKWDKYANDNEIEKAVEAEDKQQMRDSKSRRWAANEKDGQESGND